MDCSLSMGFSRQEYWRKSPIFSPGDPSWPRDWTQVSCIDRWILTTEALGKLSYGAAAAKSLQSCPILCDPIDGGPPGCPVPGILQARTREWVAISFSDAWKWKMKVRSLSRVRLLATPWTAAHQTPPSMAFPRQEYWSGVPLLSLSYGAVSVKFLDIQACSLIPYGAQNCS